MAETTCPSCDAPAPAGARACARCGYGFFEDGARTTHLPRPDRVTLTVLAGAAGLVAVIAAAAALLTGGGGDEDTATAATVSPHLTILSEHPLGRRALERNLEERYLPIPDDDEADVACSGRIPEPAHSVRRCMIVYPGGQGRRVVVITNARGAEVLTRP